MTLLEGLMKSRFGAAARAGAGFVTVSLVGAIGLVVVAVVLWAASLTPFGLWAGLPVIAASAIVAWLLWRQAQSQTGTPSQRPASAQSLASLWSAGSHQMARSLDNQEAGVARPARVRLIGRPAAAPSLMPRLVVRDAAAHDAEALKRAFDQAFSAGQFNEAERVLAELETVPGQGEWASRKHRLVRQQRERF